MSTSKRKHGQITRQVPGDDCTWSVQNMPADVRQLWTIALSLSPDDTAAEWLLRTSLEKSINSNDLRRGVWSTNLRHLTSVMVSTMLIDPIRFETADTAPTRYSDCGDHAVALQRFLRRLPRLDRVVLTLRELEGWDVQDIAKLLGLTDHAVLARQTNARLAVGKWLSDRVPCSNA